MSRTDLEPLVRRGAWAAVALVAASVVLASFWTPLGFDESWNLQVPLHLADGSGYATDGSLDGSGPRAFDAYMSTGPVLLVPVAGAVALLGEHLWVYRLVPVLAFVLLLALAARHGRLVAGPWGAVAAAAAVLAVSPAAATAGSSPIAGPGDVLGEVLAAALLLAAALAVRRPGLAGLLAGAAVLTKTVAALALPGVAAGVAVAWWVGRRDPRDGTGTGRRGIDVVFPLALLGLAAALPTVVWQAVRFLTVGPEVARARNREWLQFLGGGGSGLDGRSGGLLASVASRLADVARGVAWPALLLLLAAAALAVGLLARERWRARRPPTAGARPPDGPSDGPSDGLRDATVLGARVALAVGVASTGAWWLLLSSRDWPRHVVPALLLLVVLGVVEVVAALRRLPRAGRPAVLAAGLLAAGLVVAPTAHAVSAWRPAGVPLADQRAVAADLRATGADHFVFVGWFQAPEIALLSGVPAKVLDERGGVLVVAPFEEPYAARLTELERTRLCDDVLVERAGYVVCEVRPGPLPDWARPENTWAELPAGLSG